MYLVVGVLLLDCRIRNESM